MGNGGVAEIRGDGIRKARNTRTDGVSCGKGLVFSAVRKEESTLQTALLTLQVVDITHKLVFGERAGHAEGGATFSIEGPGVRIDRFRRRNQISAVRPFHL